MAVEFFNTTTGIRTHADFFTSDSHFFHKNIINLCGRPFEDVEQMNDELVRKWNEVVGVDDVIVHCGDFSLTSSVERLSEVVPLLNGTKILIPGNHDVVSSVIRGKATAKKKYDDYMGQFFTIVPDVENYFYDSDNDVTGTVSHYPFNVTEEGNDHAERGEKSSTIMSFLTPIKGDEDPSRLLIHGHTHSSETFNEDGTAFHVGVDAVDCDYAPVSAEAISQWVASHQ